MSANTKPDILHIEACNFVNKPTGGQLNFSRQLMEVFGARLALAGWTTSAGEPIGHWFDKNIDGTIYKYYAFGREILSERKPLIPARLTTLCQIRRHRKRIISIGIPNIILSEHAILMGLRISERNNLCYRFPGTESPLSISRYFFAKWISKFFDDVFLNALNTKAKCILAAADEKAIAALKGRSNGKLEGRKVTSFPTRVDTRIFRPADKIRARKKLGLPVEATIAVSVGRIHWAKGYKFLLDSFRLFHAQFPDAMLVFIGDGVERENLEKYIQELDLNNSVMVAGFHPRSSIAEFLQSADLFVMGSLKEGWSTVLVEALASHLPIVTTRFSSADTIVRDGINGFVVDRNSSTFAKAMEDALKLPAVSNYSAGAVENYALKNLALDLTRLWPLI